MTAFLLLTLSPPAPLPPSPRAGVVRSTVYERPAGPFVAPPPSRDPFAPAIRLPAPLPVPKR